MPRIKVITMTDIFQDAIQQGLAPAIVVAIYLVIIKIIEFRKDNNQTKLNSTLVKSVNDIGNFLNIITNDIISKDKDKCKATVETAMYSSAMRLNNFVLSTVINNHIDLNKENIITNIHNIVNAEYYSIYNVLSLYKINNVCVCNYLKKEWIAKIENDIIDIIFNTKLSKEIKIITFSNKINLEFQTYITYIINNVN